MVRTRLHRLAAESASVRLARHAVRDVVPGLDGDTLDRLLLCTSEIVTNAVEHGTPPIDLRVAKQSDTIRVEVSDASDLHPKQGRPAAMAIRGRGLLIVEQCSERWGVEPGPAGKTVWFEVSPR
ncbi:MAG: ATP-binding protein [Acidimicrobiales bacterium]